MHAGKLRLWLVRLDDLLDPLRPRLAVAAASAVRAGARRQDVDATRALAHDVDPPEAVTAATND